MSHWKATVSSKAIGFAGPPKRQSPAACLELRSRRLVKGVTRSHPTLLRAKPSSSGNESGEPSTSASETRVSSVHWSSKIKGEDAKDSYRYMDVGALREMGTDLPWDIQSVLRDRDNVTFVGDEALVVTFLSKETGWTTEETEQKLTKLVTVLPALMEEKGRLAKVGVARLSELCDNIPGIVDRLLRLKGMFPACDVGTMVSKHPFMLTEDIAVLEGGLSALRELFPFAGDNGTPGVDRMVQAVPQLLDSDFSCKALEELRRLYGPTAPEMVHRNPMLILQVESAALRSRFSVSFDQTHVKANKVIPLSERIDEPYYRT